MVDERELWACANTVIEQYGERADQFVSERITSLATEGDQRGVTTWKAIATRMSILCEMEPADRRGRSRADASDGKQ